MCWATWVPRVPPLELKEARTELEDVMKRKLKPGPLHSVSRNASLERVLPGLRIPQAHKTGTTIAGLVFRVSRDLGLGGGGCGGCWGIGQELSQRPLSLPRTGSFWARIRGPPTIRL